MPPVGMPWLQRVVAVPQQFRVAAAQLVRSVPQLFPVGAPALLLLLPDSIARVAVFQLLLVQRQPADA